MPQPTPTPSTIEQHEIATVALKLLKPAKYNPRKMTPEAKEGLAESMERFGVLQPIVWNRRTGNIVGGHRRFDVLKARGVKETDVVRVDVDETTERAMNIALNNPAIQGEFRPDLQPLLDEIMRDRADLYEALRFEELRGDPPPDERDTAGGGGFDEAAEGGGGIRYEVVATCSSAADQRDLLERLKAEGYTVSARTNDAAL